MHPADEATQKTQKKTYIRIQHRKNGSNNNIQKRKNKTHKRHETIQKTINTKRRNPQTQPK